MLDASSVLGIRAASRSGETTVSSSAIVGASYTGLNDAMFRRSGGERSAINFMAIKRRGRVVRRASVIVRSWRRAGCVLSIALCGVSWQAQILSAYRRKRQTAVESGYEVPLVELQTSS